MNGQKDLTILISLIILAFIFANLLCSSVLPKRITRNQPVRRFPCRVYRLEMKGGE